MFQNNWSRHQVCVIAAFEIKNVLHTTRFEILSFEKLLYFFDNGPSENVGQFSWKFFFVFDLFLIILVNTKLTLN